MSLKGKRTRKSTTPVKRDEIQSEQVLSNVTNKFTGTLTQNYKFTRSRQKRAITGMFSPCSPTTALSKQLGQTTLRDTPPKSNRRVLRSRKSLENKSGHQRSKSLKLSKRKVKNSANFLARPQSSNPERPKSSPSLPRIKHKRSQSMSAKLVTRVSKDRACISTITYQSSDDEDDGFVIKKRLTKRGDNVRSWSSPTLKRDSKTTDSYSASSLSIKSRAPGFQVVLRRSQVCRPRLVRTCSAAVISRSRHIRSLSTEQQAEYISSAMDEVKTGMPVRRSKDGTGRITCDEVVALLQGEYQRHYDKFLIVDCRFPYEYRGGHIKGSVNLRSKTDVEDFFKANCNLTIDVLLIFHCEYSRERGPSACRYLRQLDRNFHANLTDYGNLTFQNICVMEGGFKNFYQGRAEWCEGSRESMYVSMEDKNFVDDCRRETVNCGWRRTKHNQTRTFLPR